MSKEEKTFIQKVKESLPFSNRTPEEKELVKAISFIEDFQSQVPERYNQVELLDYLFDERVDHLFSISNRTDGKSFNYINFFIEFSIQFKIGFMLIARHYTLRQAYADFIEKIYTKKSNLNVDDLSFRRTDDYIIIYHANRIIGIITDLNNATDLKYHSNFLEEFPIMIYDEFLAISSDYLIDEYQRLETIYTSVDRTGTIPLIKNPKIFYLGNAVNFESPLLSAFNLFNKLEKHTINTMRRYDNIVLEMRKNDNANNDRNLRAFNSDNDAMTTGQFTINNFNIATEKERLLFHQNSETFHIKLDERFLSVTYDRTTFKCLLSIVEFSPTYEFNTMIRDNNGKSIYLKENFYSERQPKKYSKNLFLFDNAFSKNYITSRVEISAIKLNKCIAIVHKTKEPTTIQERNEQNYERVYEQETLKALYNKFNPFT